MKSDTEASGGALTSYRQIEIVNSVFADNFVEGGEGNHGYRVAGGAAYIEVSSYDSQQQQYIGGDARIINSTFDGNYINSKSDYMGATWGGTISYGGWNQTSSKTLIFNSIVSNSSIYKNSEIYTGNDDNSQGTFGLALGTASSQYFKVYADYSSIQENSAYNTIKQSIDLLGRQVNESTKGLIFNLYENGLVEKKYILKH